MKPKRFAARLRARLCLTALTFSSILAARGALYLFTDNGGGSYSASASGLSQTIPDNDPSGVAYALNFGAIGQTISSMTVTFTISGGYNGDLYACLTHGSSTLTLLNRVGTANGASGSALFNFGYSGSGFNNLTLGDSGAGNIHNYGGSTLNSVPTTGGTYQPDGQSGNPLIAPTGFSAAGGSATFASMFGGSDPYGNWTLFFSDASGGSLSSLGSWSVGIETVPESANVALGLFGLLFAAANILRFHRHRHVQRARKDSASRT